MSSGTPVWAVLVVAALGVVGTLAAAVITQILSGRREARLGAIIPSATGGRRHGQAVPTARTRAAIIGSRELVSPAPSVPQRKPRSRWRPGYWLRHPAIGVPFSALLVLAVVYCGLGSLPSENVERHERTVGTVRELHDRQWWASVSFTTRSGEKVTTWTDHLPWDEPTVGDEVDVTYDPADPIGSAALSGHEPGYQLLGILLLGGGAVLALAYPWWLWRNWKRLRDGAEAWRQRRPVPQLGAR